MTGGGDGDLLRLLFLSLLSFLSESLLDIIWNHIP